MKRKLLKFAENNDLGNACLELLEGLHIPMSQRDTAEPIVYEDYFEGNIPRQIQSALAKIDRQYYISEIDENIFNEKRSSGSFTDKVRELEQKYDSIFVFGIDVKKDISFTKGDMCTLARAFNRIVDSHPVILIARHDYYLSLSTCERRDAKQKWIQHEIIGKVSTLFQINCKNPHRGHLEILNKLIIDKCKSFDELYNYWLKQFSVSTLNTVFYQRVQEWFYWAAAIVDCPQLKSENDKQAFIIKMLARIMMCWFVKEKHDLNGKSAIPEILMGFQEAKELIGILRDAEYDYFYESSSYYCAVLYNLFFCGLGSINKNIEFVDLFCNDFDKSNLTRVPYLNCSLFNKSANDYINNLDEVYIPNSLFFGDKLHDGLFEIFTDYKFTIEENTPDDIDIALAPELLGMLFENLLAEIDPRTKETVKRTIRKARGAYHTPECILDEMVKDSIYRYLISKISNANTDDVKKDIHDLVYSGIKTPDKCNMECVKALYTISILDPACGSGSFPLNVLKNIDRILSIIDADSRLWLSYVLEPIKDSVAKEQIKEQLLKQTSEGNRNYTRKMMILRNCIYGLDIQPLAIIITKLRFYISLIADQKLDFSAPNYGILPLPYLDAKFLCVDSLKNCQHGLYESQISEYISKKDAYFVAAKQEEFIEANTAISSIISEALNNNDIFTRTKDIENWLKDPETNLDIYKSSIFFPEIGEGFDIVIGNPPFGAIMSANDVDIYKKTYSSTIAESAIFFILMGIRELKNGGNLTFLTPKPLSYASNYKALRKKIKDDLTLLVDCGKAFEDVKFEQSIIGIQKGKMSASYQNKKYDKQQFIEICNVNKHNVDCFGLFINDVTEPELQIANQMKTGSIAFGSISTNTRGLGLQSQISKDGSYCVFGGKDITRYGTNGVKGYLDKEIGGNAEVLSDSLLFQNIVAHIENPYPHVKLIGCISPNQKCYIVDTVNQIVLNRQYSKEYIWGILNSKLISWYAYCFIYGKAIRTMHFDSVATDRIPIKTSNRTDELSTCVKDIHNNLKKGLPITLLENKHDMLVYKIYGLKYEQCKIVDPMLTFTQDDYDALI